MKTRIVLSCGACRAPVRFADADDVVGVLLSDGDLPDPREDCVFCSPEAVERAQGDGGQPLPVWVEVRAFPRTETRP